MADVVIREIADASVELSTNAQSYAQGRFSIPQWLVRWWGIESGKTQIDLQVSSRTKTAASRVTVTSGAEVVVKASDPLYPVLKPRARITVRLQRP